MTIIKEAKVKDYMERDGKRLTLNGRLLSDEEVRTLVGEANYATYSGAKRQITAGRVFTVLFIGTTAAALYLAVDGLAKNNSREVLSAYEMAAVADISLALMIVNSVAGKSRMNWVAREYNNLQSGYSFGISPSLINVRTPQSQNNYALGMTMRFSFSYFMQIWSRTLKLYKN